MRCRVLTLAGVVAGLIAFGCAKRSEDVGAAYVSPVNYKQFNCRQLAEEAVLVSERATKLRGVQGSKRPKDIVATTGDVVVFWPTTFLVNADDAQAAEYARLKGEFDAILQISVKKRCPIRFEAAPQSYAPRYGYPPVRVQQ
jgi:hypothetical protein